MLWIDKSYLRQISYRLRNFKEKSYSPYIVNCSCPLCGDSTKNLKKARFYFFEHKGRLVGKCHNCNASLSFGKFLKQFDFSLYEQYTFERYKAGAKHEDTVKPAAEADMFKVDTSKYSNSIDGLTSITKLSSTHPAVKYIQSRKIPESRYKDIFYVESFFKWASAHTDKFKSYTKDHARIVLPWIDKSGKMVAFDARSIEQIEPRYYHIVVDTSKPVYFGFNRVSSQEPKYVVEGSFDSMFLPDCIAVGTAALYRYPSHNADVTYIPDRDVRNVQVMKLVRKMINLGYKVCMLPEDFPGKDLNEFVKMGNSVEDLENIIKSNTYQGLSALNHYSYWKKCSLS